jgi:transposase-like protein
MEIARLRKELAEARMERDILKKPSRREAACGRRNDYALP